MNNYYKTTLLIIKNCSYISISTGYHFQHHLIINNTSILLILFHFFPFCMSNASIETTLGTLSSPKHKEQCEHTVQNIMKKKMTYFIHLKHTGTQLIGS